MRRWDIVRTWVFGKTGRGGCKTYRNVYIKKYTDVHLGKLGRAWEPQAPRTFFELYVGVMTDK